MKKVIARLVRIQGYFSWPMKLTIIVGIFMIATGRAQTSPCGPPTPGSPHVCITWTASVTPPPVNGYNVYRATTAGAENFGTPLNSTLIPSTQTFFYDTTVAIGTTYFYKTVAVGTGGVLSAPTPEVSASVPVPPNSPTNEAATAN